MTSASAVPWTREHTLAALHLYTLLPFGRLHSRAPEIQQLASWEGRTANSLAMKLVNFASLDPQITASGRAGLSGATNQDRSIWSELLNNWDEVAQEAIDAYTSLAISHGINADLPLLEEAATEFEEGRTRTATVQVRINQARFRKAVIASYGSTCCISGLHHHKLVIASHILPWSKDAQNRLNPQNGLCLSALHDRAYDQGLITVLPDYTVRVSAQLKTAPIDAFLQKSLIDCELKHIRLPERFLPNPAFLESHARQFGFIR